MGLGPGGSTFIMCVTLFLCNANGCFRWAWALEVLHSLCVYLLFVMDVLGGPDSWQLLIDSLEPLLINCCGIVVVIKLHRLPTKAFRFSENMTSAHVGHALPNCLQLSCMMHQTGYSHCGRISGARVTCVLVMT